MSVQTDSIAVRAVGSHRTADAASLDRLEQEIVDLDAQILAAVRRRADLARALTPVERPLTDAESRFDELGSDGPVLGRTLTRLSAAGSR
ncbi:chorismate mutase [Rhodococcus sp. TAF43]|uniref:chorismate mutase n=1 Tax=unclassified Rhodococcus (in: high G+C Gram-positive bacteria) TaxID=192944 RepID=UPI000E0B080D|nr:MULTISPECIES: chorismate mutase [unclassified Rhodococcus (in: high G+C Gram-positive bacteria)]QKT10873.1 chorismate mutase [Rhodococcus sp. W8901]RDI15672.1 chorismate mutase [Rhodococcus sp. AG1013]